MSLLYHVINCSLARSDLVKLKDTANYVSITKKYCSFYYPSGHLFVLKESNLYLYLIFLISDFAKTVRLLALG